ncbi:MAG: dTDP-4-dehydrorhamnose reductase [Flavobacteriaceae bacterium]
MGKVLVTGSGGQLGRTLQDLAPRYPDLHFDFRTAKELDITNQEQLNRVFKENSFCACINCAAYTNVEEAERNPKQAYVVNRDGAGHIAKACLEHGATLVHISTDYVFDGAKKGPYTVQDTPNPINEYGKSKWEGEKRIIDTLETYFIVRTSWLYSRKYGHNFYRTILEKGRKGEKLKVTDAQVGCPTMTDNLARFIVNELLSKKRPYGIYHYTDGESMTWYAFAKKIFIENGLDLSNLEKVGIYRTFARRPKNSTLSGTSN